MSYDLTPEALQNISVKCASLYMTKQASLSDAIAKEAQELELNPDQIKRVIETTNTITYLRQLEGAGDRTFEFPLANYKEVMASLVGPVVKQAAEEDKDEKEKSDKDSDKEDKDDKKSDSKDEDKRDSDKKSEDEESSDEDSDSKDSNDREKTASLFSEQEKIAMLSKEVLRCHQILEKMAVDKVGLHLELENAVNRFKITDHAFTKMAAVASKEDFPKMQKLCGLVKTASDETYVYRNSELADASVVYGLYKQAVDIVKQESEMKSFMDRAGAILEKKSSMSGVFNRANAKADKAVSTTASKVGQGIGGSIGWASRKVVGSPFRTDAVKNIGKFRTEAKAKGMTTSEAVKHFDEVTKTKGPYAAKGEFNGAKPSVLHRGPAIFKKTLRAADGLAGLELEHEHNIWSSLHG